MHDEAEPREPEKPEQSLEELLAESRRLREQSADISERVDALADEVARLTRGEPDAGAGG